MSSRLRVGYRLRGRAQWRLAVSAGLLTVVSLLAGQLLEAAPAAGAGMVAAGVEAGDYHSCALTNPGGVMCWGMNDASELGDGKAYPRATAPVNVSGLSSGVEVVSAGGFHTCAVTLSGGVKCWGSNDYGELGNGTTYGYSTPVDVSGLSSGVKSVSAGSDHLSCALTTAGGVKCWGYNALGQLGNGSDYYRSLTPANVSGLSSGVQQISAGGDHACAVTGSGGVKCWGAEPLGDGTWTPRESPVNVTGLSSGVHRVSAGGGHSCALTGTGGVKCWGYNGYGQLGDGTRTDRLTPVNVSGLSSGVAAISAGGDHTCALMSNSGIKCWGRNDYGQLGDGSTTDRLTPVDMSGVPYGGRILSAGLYHTCVLNGGAGISCWGWNGYGQLGNGTWSGGPTASPVNVIGFGVSPLPSAPRLINVTQSAARWRAGTALPHSVTANQPVGTTFGFTLNRAARVQFLFTHKATGRRVDGRCVPQTLINRRRPRCLVTTGIALSFRAHAGRTRLHFEGRLDRKRKLPPGLYRLTIIATANGLRSKPAVLRFTILR